MAWQEFKLLGFTPDLPVTTPGYIPYSTYIVPTDRGIGAGPKVTEDSTTALASQSLGGTVITQLDGTQRGVVGCATKLYEFSMPTPTTLTDRSAFAYSASVTNTWSITQAGDKTLAVNRADFLQQSTLPAAFASVGAAPTPKASIVISCGPTSAPFVMVFDYDDGTNNDKDGWKCSVLGGGWSGAADWTASIATQCATGRLLDNIPGAITAALPYRDGVIAWKRTGMYLGRYDGPPNIWSWQRISSDVGCIGKNACAEVNDIVYWVDDSGIWMFDGSYPRPLPAPVQKYWTEQLAGVSGSSGYRNFVRVHWDKQKHLIWFLPGIAGTIYPGTVYNTVSGIPCHSALNPFRVVPNFIGAEFIAPRYIVTDNKKIGTLTYGVGTDSAAYIASWCFSDHVSSPIIKGIRPHWAIAPAVGGSAWFSGNLYALDAERRVSPGGGITATSTTAMSFREPGRLDGIKSAEIMAFDLSINPNIDWEFTGLSIDVDKQGVY